MYQTLTWSSMQNGKKRKTAIFLPCHTVCALISSFLPLSLPCYREQGKACFHFWLTDFHKASKIAHILHSAIIIIKTKMDFDAYKVFWIFVSKLCENVMRIVLLQFELQAYLMKFVEKKSNKHSTDKKITVSRPFFYPITYWFKQSHGN